MIQIGFVDSLSVGVEMPTETELEDAWNRLEAALAQLERDPTAERSQLSPPNTTASHNPR
jgi:hypothetical protein